MTSVDRPTLSSRASPEKDAGVPFGDRPSEPLAPRGRLCSNPPRMAPAAPTPLRLQPLPLVVALTFPFVVLFVAILTIPLYADLTADVTVRSAGSSVYGVAFIALVATLGSMFFGVLGARGSAPTALVLPMGLLPMTLGLLGYLLEMREVHAALVNASARVAAPIFAAGQSEAAINWLAGSVLACGVWMGAAVTLGALGVGVPEGVRRRHLWAATLVCIALAGFAFAIALELGVNARLHRGYSDVYAASPELRAQLMAHAAALGVRLESARPSVGVGLALLMVGALALAVPGAPRRAPVSLGAGALLVVALALAVTARGWRETASISEALRAQVPQSLTVDTDAPAEEPPLQLTAQGLFAPARHGPAPVNLATVMERYGRAGRLAFELSVGATTEALASALGRLPLEGPVGLRLVGQRAPRPFVREEVPGWAAALFEAPAVQLASLDVEAGGQVDEVARLEGEVLVLGTARVPLTWAAPGGAAEGAPVGLALEPATPLSTLVKAAATVRALGRRPVFVLPQRAP